MARNFEHIIHKNSSALVDNNPKLPTSGQLEYGEIAVNYAKDKETISLKNSNNEIVTFTSDKKLDNYVTVSDFEEAMQVASAALNDLEATKLEKSVFDEAMEDLETQFSNFYTKQEADNDSLIVASALNDLEEKKLDKLDFDEMLEGLETQLSNFYTKEEIDNAELVTASALNDLNERIGSAENAFEELDKYFDENELIISSALNDLEERKANKEDLTEFIDSVYTKEEIDDDHLVISSSLNDLNTRLDAKQDTLVSGTNIKTINNQSILGNGNITIEGGSGGGGDINVIESVKVNGTALTPDANKAVDITSIPASIVTQDATHRFVSDTEKTTWNSKSDFSGSYNDLTNKPTIPAAVTESTVSGWGFTKNAGTVTGVKINNTTKNPTNGVVDLGTVITSHQDISGKADKSAAIGSLSLSLDSTNYKITLSGTKVDGTTFTVSDVIDLPLESVVVSGSYNDSTKKVVLTLQNGSTIDFSVADLVSGLQSEITSSNKLSADLISDGTTNKTVTATEKNTWNGKQDALSNANVLSGITSTKVSNWDSAATNSHTHSNKTVLDGISSNDISNWNSKTDNVGTVTGVKMNGTTNNPTSGVVDLGTVITSHQDISGKADKSAAIGSLSLSLDSTNYKITLSGTKVDGTTFTVSDVIDLPLESVVVNGSYNNTTKKVVLTLQSGSTVEFSVADLVSGLQSEITSTNKLSADLIADGTTNKVVTASEKSTWNGKQDALSNANVLSGITSTKVSNWDSAATNSHTHSNKSVLDGIKATDISNWNSKTDNVGTVTGVKMNGTTNNPTNGVVNLGTVITSETALSKGTTRGSGNAVTDISVSGHQITLTKGKTFLESETQLSKGTTTGSGNAVTDISVSGHQITLTKGTTFLTSHQSIKTLNGTALTGTGDITLTGVPAFTASDNGKILGVVNGQLAWITPTTIYTGTGTPSSSQGNNGDIYLQTS